MGISEKDREVLRALTVAREEHKELADLLDFYYELYQVQFEAKSQLPEPETRDEFAIRWRLEGGIPQVTLDQLHINPHQLANLVGQINAVFIRHNPSWAVERTEWEPDALMALSRKVFDTWETLTVPKGGSASGGQAPPDSLMALAVGFALVPYLQRAAEVTMPHLDLALWTRGYCPVCGGRPNLAVLGGETAARQLLCSRCAALWSYVRVGCPFCGAKERQTYYASEDGLYRLYVCSDCKRYLKSVNLEVAPGPRHPLVERLLTIGMDLAAQQEGWGDR